MRQLGLDDVVNIAAELTGRDPAEAQLALPLGAVERALLAPVGTYEDQLVHGTPATQAAVLFARLAQSDRVPDRMRLAWTCLREFLARNEWELRVDDADALDDLLRRVAAGQAAESVLAAWIEPRLTHVPSSPEDPGSLFADFAQQTQPLPRVVVACPANADERATSLLESWCHIIAQTVAIATQGSDDPALSREWAATCEISLEARRPDGDDALGREVFEQSSRALWSRADALILIDDWGGSVGGGQALAWAIQQGIPILCVVPHGLRVSPQIEGAKHEADISIGPFSKPDELERIVERWLASRRHAIEDGWRRREIHRGRVAAARAAAYAAWAQLDHTARFAAAATAQLKPARVHRLLTDPDALLAASLNEFLRLMSALGLEIGPVRETPAAARKRLTPKQADALLQATRENVWDGRVVIDLIERAEQTLALPGVRRIPFERMQDWVRFHDQIHDR